MTSRPVRVVISPITIAVATSGIRGPPGSRSRTWSSPTRRRCGTSVAVQETKVDRQQGARSEGGESVEVGVDGQPARHDGVERDAAAGDPKGGCTTASGPGRQPIFAADVGLAQA